MGERLARKGDEMKKPNCYECAHRRTIPGDAHSRCNNLEAKVKGHKHGINSGWFRWPLNFDPIWLLECDGFSTDEKAKQAPTKNLAQ